MGSRNSIILMVMFAGVFLFPVVLVPWALRYGSVGFGIIAMSMVGMSLVLYTKLALNGRSKKNIEWGTVGMKLPEKRLYIVGCTMLAVGILTLVQQVLLEKR